MNDEDVAALRALEVACVLVEPAVERGEVGPIGGERVGRQAALHPDGIEEPVDRTGPLGLLPPPLVRERDRKLDLTAVLMEPRGFT